MRLNKERALDFMRTVGLDAIVAASPVNVRYFSDYTCWLDPLFKEYMGSPGASRYLLPTYAVLPAHGEAAFKEAHR